MHFKKGGLGNHTIQDKQYKIITGASFHESLTLHGFVSTEPGLFYGQPKLILPHKRLAKFFKDYDGTYSCFGRDMYVFFCDNSQQIDQLYALQRADPCVVLLLNGYSIFSFVLERVT